MGRLLKFLFMFGPMIYRMYKKFTANKQSSRNSPQLQQPRQDPYGQQNRTRTQSKDGKWDFQEGENPLG